jgi:hypothetical protein
MDLNYLIVILVFILAIIELIKERYYKDKIPKWLVALTIIILFVSAVANIIIEKQKEEAEKYSKYSGQISGKLKDKNIIYPVLKLGGANLTYNGQSGEPIFLIGNDPIKIWVEDGQLKLSTVIRDSSGKIIAKLDANEWQVNPNLIFDRNFDENAVEVIDEKGKVILQVQFDGEGVQFAGIFYREDGWKVALGPTEGGGVIEIRPPNENLTISFDRLFKYPSDVHRGERE